MMIRNFIFAAVTLAASNSMFAQGIKTLPEGMAETIIGTTLSSASPGDPVELKAIDFSMTKPVLYKLEVIDGPQYLISDDPEYIRIPEGVALREDVSPGNVRLYVYNVNGVKEPEMPRKISVVIENLSEDEELNVDFLNYSFREPSMNYFGVAKNGLTDYFNSATQDLSDKDLVIAPKEAQPLDLHMEETVADFNDLVHALHEFSIDQPARISIVQTDPETPSVEANAKIEEVIPSPRKNAGRGKFEISNYKLTTLEGSPIDTADGVQELIVADGDKDPWVKGIDGSSGEELELRGNYGIMYEMEIERTSSDGRSLALVTYNQRFGSQWCGAMANVMKVDDGNHKGGVVRIPTGTLNTRSLPEVVVIQTFPPLPEGESEIIKLTYSPPGASCLPTPLVFVPYTAE